MPNVLHYAQQIQSIMGSGGIVSSENRVAIQYAVRMLDELRASAAVEYYRQKLSIPERLYQTTALVYDDDYQNSDDAAKCLYLYPAPSIIPFSTVHDGISYIGVRNGENLNRIKSQAALDNYKKHYVTKKRIMEEPWVLYNPDFSEVLFHKPFGGPTKALLMRAVYVRPTALPEYNIEADEYPITDEIFNMVIRLAQEQFSRSVLSTPAESIPNGISDAGSNNANLQNNNA